MLGVDWHSCTIVFIWVAYAEETTQCTHGASALFLVESGVVVFVGVSLYVCSLLGLWFNGNIFIYLFIYFIYLHKRRRKI